MVKITEQTKEKFKEAIVNDIVQELQRTVAVDTGNLKANIIYRKVSGGYEISMPYYGKFVEFGTAPHIIRPVNAKALVFPKAGGRMVHHKDGTKSTKFTYEGKTVMDDVVFAKVVHHPGTRPQPFIRPTLRGLGRIIRDNLEVLTE